MKMKRALGAISATALAALWSVPAMAAWTLNLREGVTELSREIYGLHMLILWICVVIAVAVFSVMIYSIATFRKSKGAVPATFEHNTKAEIIWTVIPVMILVAMAVPAARTLVKIDDTRGADMTIKATGYQWKWQYDYVDEGVSYFSTLAQTSNEAGRSTRASTSTPSRTTCSKSTTRWSCRSTRRCACSSPPPTSSTTGGCRTSA
jgi:cytochrome c oxidase subunit 2